ncbi:EAL domain, c-di-GMP-specific phosphodiesterase class I (or its enzymatically inactive variant) [Pseudobutyrivibrio sp. ACV-2]|uniref:EAL domain-containing protein n=1 Tax=Pseudobutyrivibrio sp. ACV-2 TaxID=1520801 RepID=UPI00089BA3C0|nr:EAL domain-containing protein [Pseudobutyrivibrio sp. ACV-2]SEA65618.1 EAL domain, c-di-GMP-specific phosphodiesterase class I (or its enzymatically inactive variant) [Pseudobutyrivibrio sp. ACV-2]
MWNMDYAIPSLMILTVIVGHYVSLPRLPVKRNRTFVYLIVMVYLGITLDIASTMADMNYQSYSSAVLYILNSAYFIFFLCAGYSFFYFTAVVLNSSFLKNTGTVFLSQLPLNLTNLIILSAPWTKWFYYIDETGYHSAPLYYLLYAVWGIYIIFSYVAIVYRQSEVLRKREIQILTGCNTVLLIGLLARYLFPAWLLEQIFILAAFIVLFLGFENPDMLLEERTYIFNKVALREYVGELNGIKSIDAIVICDRSYSEKLELYGAKQTNQGVYLVQNYMHSKFPGYLIFYYGNGRFIMFNRKKTGHNWDEVYRLIKDRFIKPWVSKNTEIWFLLGASTIHLENEEIPFETIIRVFDEAFAIAENGNDDSLQKIDNTIIDKITKEREIIRSLDKAIEEDGVEIFLQPIVNSETGKLAGAEALARIRDSEGKIIPPGLFIHIAEKNGKINQLGKQVFRKCCEYSINPDIQKLNLSFINVNLSPVQFMRMDLVETLNNYVKDTGANGDFIHLEITEEALIDEQLIDRQISLLTTNGFKFVLDDYGTGYSNISRLRKTPFINIKLDMSIVWDYCKNPDYVLPSEISAFRKSGFEITAEGIEDEQMAKTMYELGCTYLQGYYFSKPLPVNEFIAKYESQ